LAIANKNRQELSFVTESHHSWPFRIPPHSPTNFPESHKLFEREICSENISGIIQNNLGESKSQVTESNKKSVGMEGF
jgi:hypothetical protein